MIDYQTSTLNNGMRVILLPSSSPVVYCGLAIGAGTRHELPGEEGLAHFCEHLTFKGTNRRSALQVINALERVGGELNAFTNKEDTVFYCAIKKQHLTRAVDLLCDIVFNSTYPQSEVEKECQVVCDEIESYEDSPAELIFDEIENILFKGHPLGHNILGSANQLRGYTSVDALRFTRRYYQPHNCVFFASGDVDCAKLLKQLGKVSASAHEVPTLPTPSFSNPPTDTVITRQRATHQAHVMVGTRAFAADDPRRWSLYLLNNILGGPGMNSRLNLSLRERRGLVYTVESTMVCYSDTGLWCTYFGCDQSDVHYCLRLMRKELDRLINHPLSAGQLRNAKCQIEGQLAIASDSREQFALDFAKNFLHHGKERDVDDIMAHINVLTADNLQQTAAEIFANDRLTTLVYE